ncbi:hypothetical protein GCM10008018_45820 [Paenibacillus marchantiophytorum]|uniref:Transposase IS4-like domain-containing protein n=1 Tax=Paenibacillus marchantiophytorum TaxID=1619310 RepID=A0ABQ1EZV2_9BACL|nr:hypothetical protein GCM10008018_45820 [Paenibacillus marchantiophytorum]
MLTLGWSDGFSFAPIDFVMFSSAKLVNRICEMKEHLYKRSHGYKRRLEALTRKPDAVVDLLQRALSAGFTAGLLKHRYFGSLIQWDFRLLELLKEMKQRYRLNDKLMSLKELYSTLPKNKNNEILGSVIVETACGLPVKLVFVQNRNKRREWLAILSTDLTVSAEEVVRIYGMRWSIETFFKFTKSYLKLGTEFQGRSFDMLISHTTVVFSRYLVMEFERRQENDTKSLGGLFFLFADEVRDLDYQTALQQLMTFFLQIAKAKTKREKSNVFCQLHEWILGLPSYIKGLFKDLSCES